MGGCQPFWGVRLFGGVSLFRGVSTDLATEKIQFRTMTILDIDNMISEIYILQNILKLYLHADVSKLFLEFNFLQVLEYSGGH